MKAIRGLLAALVVGSAIVVAAPSAAYACSCVPRDVPTHVREADVVVSGVLVGTRFDPGDGDPQWALDDRAVYEVEPFQVHKGDAEPTIEVRSRVSGAACGLEGMKVGGLYVFFLREEQGSLEANLCGGTAAATSTYAGRVLEVTGVPRSTPSQDPVGAKGVVLADGGDGGGSAWPLVGGGAVAVVGLVTLAALVVRRRTTR